MISCSLSSFDKDACLCLVSFHPLGPENWHRSNTDTFCCVSLGDRSRSIYAAGWEEAQGDLRQLQINIWKSGLKELGAPLPAETSLKTIEERATWLLAGYSWSTNCKVSETSGTQSETAGSGNHTVVKNPTCSISLPSVKTDNTLNTQLGWIQDLKKKRKSIEKKRERCKILFSHHQLSLRIVPNSYTLASLWNSSLSLPSFVICKVSKSEYIFPLHNAPSTPQRNVLADIFVPFGLKPAAFAVSRCMAKFRVRPRVRRTHFPALLMLSASDLTSSHAGVNFYP